MSRVPTVLVALVLLAFALAAPGRNAARADEQEDTEREVEAAIKAMQGQLQPATPAALETLAKSILEEMAAIRKLPRKSPVSMEVATREQIVSYVDSRIKEEMKGEELEGQEAALKRLGLLPEKLDMRSFLLDLYGEQVAGYYDPFQSRFYIASWMQPMLQAPIMAHELTHALQDQHFDLKPFLTPLPGNSDATSARQALVEGDAVVAMFDYLGVKMGAAMPGPLGPMLRQQMISSQYPVFRDAPPYFQEALFFPYADGADFVTEVKKRGGWPAVTKLYKDLPKSSEQVLHPEKYLAKHRDDPTDVPLAIKVKGMREIHTDVLGEVVVRILLAGFAGAEEAAVAAAGWDGDRYRAFHPEGRPTARKTMIVHRSVWDTAEDAREFQAAWEKSLRAKYEGGVRREAKKDGGRPLFVTVEDGVALVERRDREVVLVDGAPDVKTAETVARQAWGR